jgi:hypothetical protein
MQRSWSPWIASTGQRTCRRNCSVSFFEDDAGASPCASIVSGLVSIAQPTPSSISLVALLAGIGEHTRRLRGKKPASDVEARIQPELETSDLMERICGHLAEYLRAGRARSSSTPPG